MLTRARLLEVLHYDPLTGVFTWKVDANRNAGVYAGDVAGVVNSAGYVSIGVDGRRYLAHRLAWFAIFGSFPTGSLIDHADGDRLNNRASNLRLADYSQNGRNSKLSRANTSGLKGACFDRSRGLWMASIKVRGKQRNLGRFPTAQEAHAAYVQAAQKASPRFARTE